MSDHNGNGSSSSPTIDELLGRITLRRAIARILLDQNLVDEHERLEVELATAAARDAGAGTLTSATPRQAEELIELEDRIEAAKVAFTFEQLGDTAYTALLAKCPPNDEQRRMGRAYNSEKFDEAIIAACCVEPRMTLDQAKALRGRLDRGRWQQLLAAALNANEGGGETPKSGIATAILKLRDRSSTTADPGGSLAASSSGGD